MGFQETFNSRVLPAAERAFGVSATLECDAGNIEVRLLQSRRDASTDRRSLLGDQFVSARTQEFIASASALTVDEVFLPPKAYDRISWIDTDSGEQSWLVFPLVSERCFKYLTATDSRMWIYAVEEEGLADVEINSPSVPAFTCRGIPSTIRGQEIFDNQTSKLLTTVVYIPRTVFASHNITTPPMMATITLNGEAWSVNMAETEWGPGLVKLGLEREVLTRDWQARRNAAV